MSNLLVAGIPDFQSLEPCYRLRIVNRRTFVLLRIEHLMVSRALRCCTSTFTTRGGGEKCRQ